VPSKAANVDSAPQPLDSVPRPNEPRREPFLDREVTHEPDPSHRQHGQEQNGERDHHDDDERERQQQSAQQEPEPGESEQPRAETHPIFCHRRARNLGMRSSSGAAAFRRAHGRSCAAQRLAAVERGHCRGGFIPPARTHCSLRIDPACRLRGRGRCVAAGHGPPVLRASAATGRSRRRRAPRRCSASPPGLRAVLSSRWTTGLTQSARMPSLLWTGAARRTHRQER
jgi:hypothetical protein